MIVRAYLFGGVGRGGRGTRGTPNWAVGVTSRLLLGWTVRGPVEPDRPDRYFSFVQTRTEPLPLTYVPATVRHGWLGSGHGRGRCARARHAQCRQLYHGPGDRSVRP